MNTEPTIILIGALAYDQIATTGRPLDQRALRNAKLATLRQDFGGCAGNMAYSCAALGTRAIPIGTLGSEDAASYIAHLERLNVSCQGVLQLPGRSPQGMVITDPNGDQFTSFYPGPSVSNDEWEMHLQTALPEHAAMAVMAPFPYDLTIAAFKSIKSRYPELPTIWVPGQYADMLSAEQLAEGLKFTDLLLGNAWEVSYIENKVSHDVLTLRTDGPGIMQLRSSGTTHAEHPVQPARSVDPTGCGDALCAALACALIQHDKHLNTASILEHLSGAVAHAQKCLATVGCQNFASTQMASS